MANPVYSNAQVIQQLDSGTFWSTGGGVVSTITYGVTTNKPRFPSGYSEYAGCAAPSQVQAGSLRTIASSHVAAGRLATAPQGEWSNV